MSENNKLEIKVTKKDFSQALVFANSAVEKKNVIIELSYVKLVAKNGVLEIGVTDMDVYLNQEIGAEVISEGQTTVSISTLSDIVRKIPDSEIKLIHEENSNKLDIIGANCKFELLTLPASKFPLLEDLESEVKLDIDRADFARLIEYTIFSISTEETRYNLNGVYMHAKENVFACVSTDGHRLSAADIKLGKKFNEFGVIVPRKTVSELLKILLDFKNLQFDIQITLSSTKIKFQFANIILISKLIDGTFPEYSSFIPKDNKNKLTINSKLLNDAIDRVAVVTVDKFRAVKLIIDDKSLTVNASGEAKGTAKEVINYSTEDKNFCLYEGENISIGFNPKYLSDVMSTLAEKQVEIYLDQSQTPILIKTSADSHDNFVVMPVKV